ncbi:cyclin-dependent kinase 20 isoform X8 [Loxodonta africana]|uniref:cyclin-dependent kinase 20 isoform X8 n=1 Tax=Loxodonta africana TaxID=9785 RepID=UPI0005403C60
MDQYCILGRIGEGAHGIVFKAKHVETGDIVALKKVALRRLEDGIPNQALREIKALQEIEDNQYVVQLKAVFPHGAGFVLAFEFMLSDLAEVVRHAQRPLAQAQVKSYLQMLLKGVAFCHANSIVHRDLKPANLLISASGQLKIADFGLARVFSPDGSRLYTHQVATRWYRAPELLYGARQYDQGVDLWAVGCIMGELLNGSALFPGENDIEQLCCVLRILGTPSPQVWPEITELPDYNKISFKEQTPVPLEEVLPDASPQALDLLGQFLLYPPRQRITASQPNLTFQGPPGTTWATPYLTCSHGGPAPDKEIEHAATAENTHTFCSAGLTSACRSFIHQKEMPIAAATQGPWASSSTSLCSGPRRCLPVEGRSHSCWSPGVKYRV